MLELDYMIRFGAALTIGFSIGLQREVSHGGEGNIIQAGERTFALLALCGALAAMASDHFGQPLVFFGLSISIGLLVVAGYVYKARNNHFGMTTEAAILVTVILGGLCYWNYIGLAGALAIATTLILSVKLETDRLVESLTRSDIFAALQFAIISAIVLPILPNESPLPVPFDVLNPFRLWLMVVFISGISFLGYLLIKILGSERGIGLTGLLGGVVSSTAVTLALAPRSSKKGKVVRPLALAIMMAWAVMYARVAFQIAIVNWDLLQAAWIPLGVSCSTGIFYVIYLWQAQGGLGRENIKFDNPFNIMTALVFGLMFAIVLLISRVAQLYFGNQGVLISSFISGFSGVNAITLTLAELSSKGGLSLRVATQGIILATATNMLFQGLLVARMGSVKLRKALLPGVALILVAGTAAMLYL